MRNYKASSQAHVQAIRQWGLEGEGYTLIVYNNSSTGRIERKLSFSSDAKGRRIIVSKKGNETIVLYQDDQSQTKLPFTGSNSRWIILLSISMSSILLGLIVIILNRRREK